MTETDVNLSIVLVGDASVGKTSLITRFVDDKFEEGSSKPTVGIDYLRKMVELEGIKVLVRFWDTAGTEKYGAVSDTAIKMAAGAVLVYDVTKRGSFDQLRFWMMKLHEKSRPNLKIILIGNKKDLELDRVVSTAEGEKFAKENGMFFMECSAKEEAGNVFNAFNTLVEETFSVQREVHTVRMSVVKPKLAARILTPSSLQTEQKKGCCG